MSPSHYLSPSGVVGQDSGSGSSVAEASPLSSPRHSQMVTSTYAVKRGPSGYGMILKAIRVYIGQSDDYRIHHIIEVWNTHDFVSTVYVHTQQAFSVCSDDYVAYTLVFRIIMVRVGK